jgi:hypothetical protein
MPGSGNVRPPHTAESLFFGKIPENSSSLAAQGMPGDRFYVEVCTGRPDPPVAEQPGLRVGFLGFFE